MLSVHAKHGMKGYQCGNYCNNDLITMSVLNWLKSTDRYRHLLLTLLNRYYNDFRYFKERVRREKLIVESRAFCFI